MNRTDSKVVTYFIDYSKPQCVFFFNEKRHLKEWKYTFIKNETFLKIWAK